MSKIIAALLFSISAACALAQPAVNPPPSAETPPSSRIKLSGHVDAGVTANPQSPDDHLNFGHLFDDRSNEPMLNQVLLTAERPLDATARGFDWGFRLQGMFGSDARYIHSTGLLDRTTSRTLQPDLVEAYLNTHFAVDGTAGGIDVKLGKFVTLEGAEVIDSTGNTFYSHSYVFNFGVPLNHTGALATIHATKDVDLMVGLTQGVNTFRDNNDTLAFHGGISLPNLAGGKLALVLSTHVGPETPHNQTDYRYLHDLVAIYKISDTLTTTTDVNYIQDDLARAKGYGIAQYLTTVVSKTVNASVRAEVWRDNNGFFVAQFGNNTDFLALERGDVFTPDSRTVGGGITTYGALTFGVSWKPSGSVMVRPEVRYDRSLNSTRPFRGSQDRDQLTAAVDVTWSF